MSSNLRFPAEWEPQSRRPDRLAHAGTDWADRLPDVERTYVALAAAVTRFQTLLVCVADAALQAHATGLLAAGGVAMDRVALRNPAV